MTIGEFLKTAREESGMSQVDVAKKLGYRSGQLISNAERGLCPFPIKSLRTLCLIYDTEPKLVAEKLVSAYRAKVFKELKVK